MFRITLILLPIVATTLMGMAVIAVLSMDMQAGWQPIAIASAPHARAAARPRPSTKPPATWRYLSERCNI